MGNPLIDQGILNRIKASVVWNDHPELNVNAPYLDRDGVTLRLEGQGSTQHETMTGIVQSPEPFMPVSVVIALLRTQPLSESYKSQMEDDVILGSATVWPDVAVGGISSYQLFNMAIQSVGDLAFNGSTPIFAVTCRGYYITNNSLFK